MLFVVAVFSHWRLLHFRATFPCHRHSNLASQARESLQQLIHSFLIDVNMVFLEVLWPIDWLHFLNEPYQSPLMSVIFLATKVLYFLPDFSVTFLLRALHIPWIMLSFHRPVQACCHRLCSGLSYAY